MKSNWSFWMYVCVSLENCRRWQFPLHDKSAHIPLLIKPHFMGVFIFLVRTQAHNILCHRSIGFSFVLWKFQSCIAAWSRRMPRAFELFLFFFFACFAWVLDVQCVIYVIFFLRFAAFTYVFVFILFSCRWWYFI